MNDEVFYRKIAQLEEDAKKLAERWVKACEPYGKYPIDIRLDFKNRQITFGSRYSDGGAFSQPTERISFDYFDDSTTLEQDAKNRKKEYDRVSFELSGKVDQIKKNPVFEELRKAEQAYNSHVGWSYYGQYLNGHFCIA